NGTKAAFEDIATVNTGRFIWTREDGTPEQVRVAAVTPNFFRLLGAQVALGRDFSEADGQPQPPAQAGAQAPPRLPAMALLSHKFWQRRYGGRTAILGRTAGTNRPQIVGVLPPRFAPLLRPPLNP